MLLLQGPLQLRLELQQGGTAVVSSRIPAGPQFPNTSCTQHANDASWLSALAPPPAGCPQNMKALRERLTSGSSSSMCCSTSRCLRTSFSCLLL